MANNESLSEKTKNCIKECLDCYQVCVRTKVHCLTLGEEHARANHIGLLSMCAEVCRLAAHAMLSESEFQKKICALCVEICKQCGQVCGKFTEDEIMQTCSDVCYKCATVCEAMTA